MRLCVVDPGDGVFPAGRFVRTATGLGYDATLVAGVPVDAPVTFAVAPAAAPDRLSGLVLARKALWWTDLRAARRTPVSTDVVHLAGSNAAVAHLSARGVAPVLLPTDADDDGFADHVFTLLQALESAVRPVAAFGL